MMSMKSFTLKTKLYALAGILIAFMILSTSVSLQKMNAIGNEITDIAEQDIPLTDATNKVAIHQLEQAVSFERILRYGEAMQNNADARSHYNSAVELFNTQSFLVNAFIKTGEAIAYNAIQFGSSEQVRNEFKHIENILTTIETQHKSYDQHVHEVINKLANGNVAQALEQGKNIEIEENKLNQALESLLAELENFTEAAILQAEHDEQSAFQLLVIIAGLSMFIGVGMAVFIIRNLLENIRSAVKVAETISAGDLSQKVEPGGDDEMGQLLRSLSTMRDNLYKMVTQMNDASAQLASSSEEFAAVAEETNENINNQQSEIEQAATAINQMTATIQEVARNSANTSETAQATNIASADGQAAFKQTVHSINQLADDIDNASSVIHNLESHSDNIGGVLSVIKDIAEQTNLLALNAAIEAARAGEQGRGFAVVADEVRTLASRTQDSTSEIEGMIEKLQNGSREAVRVMDHSRKQATQSVEFADTVGAKLQAITESVSLISNMSTEIATAAEEQACVSDEINRNIVAISNLGSQNAAGANETTASSEELAQVATDLHDLIAQFKV